MNSLNRILLKLYRYLVQLDDQENRRKFFKAHGLKIGENVRLKHRTSILQGDIEIGNNTYVHDFARIVSGENSKVVIGDNCAIGRFFGCASRTHDLHQPTRLDEHGSHLRIEKTIRIGDGVWIGDRVTIKEGVTIGDYAIIGANSVVTRDVQPFEVVGGVPARHIRYNSSHILFPNEGV